MDIQKERKAFETWLFSTEKFKCRNKSFLFMLDDFGTYEDQPVLEHWETWQAAKTKAVPECKWSQNEDGYFDASCGQSFVFSEPEDKPSKHKFTHCCFCGGKLVEAQEPAND
ncbi:hypothetical protein [Acinetobacter sp. BSP-53]|uniref:hypothetical protein n=1 Tax=Acinetobacter sp. BSP-53 TaxID=3344662 RepID=UPI0037703CA0